ncbi:MAG: alpha/beta hydrolase [Acidimicrobiales bacterium]
MAIVTPDSFELDTDDGIRLAAAVWPAPTVQPPAAVVLTHGLSISKDHASVLAHASGLTEAGFGVVTYDGRGHGASGGVCTLGTEETYDVAAAVSFARSLAPLVVAVGSSMGGIAVLRYGAGGGDLDGLVTVSVPARWRIRSTRSLVAAVMTRTGLGRRFVRARTGVRLAPAWSSPSTPEQLAAHITCPAAIVHGSRDRFIPAAEARLLYERLPGRRRIDIVDGMGHGFGPRAVAAVTDAVWWAVQTATPARPAQGRCGPPSPG